MMHKKIIGYKAVDITRNVIQAQMELDSNQRNMNSTPNPHKPKRGDFALQLFMNEK